ncbi:MAG: metal-dependent hydrolase [Kiritimatiellae bacterium]|nr:metal-dependent hydrolase [Kiritimatiellia bacterium]
MPSPIAHATMGCVTYRFYRNRLARLTGGRLPPWALVLLCVGLSLLPDFDAIPGLLFGDFGRYHNTVTHSLFCGLAVAFAWAAAARKWRGSGFLGWFGIVLLCYQLHILMDFFTMGRGVMAFWPYSAQRYQSVAKLFFGLHWSDGIWSKRHLLTISSELIFALLMWLIVRILFRTVLRRR